jgi:gliding motility-associated-like protein
MKRLLKNIVTLLICTAFSCLNNTQGQICINKFSAIKLQGTTYDTFTRSVVTAKNEIISAGTLYDYNTAAHIAKFSEKGSPIWSYQYSIDFFDFVKLIFFKAVRISDIVSTADGGFVIAGNVEQVLSPFGLPPPVRKWGLLAKIDKIGNVLWTKTLANDRGGGDLGFTNIYQTTDGDIIAYLATDNGKKELPGDHSYGKVLRVGSNGKIKWSTFLFSYLFDAGGLGVENKKGILQASNGNIVIGDIAHKTVPNTGEIREGNLHFFELNYATGKLNWERSYEYGAFSNTYVPDIVNIKELGNGKFSFITTLYLTGANGLVKRGANIITSNRGALENIIAYTPADGSPCNITEAAIDKNNGNRVLLFDKGGKGMLVNINDNGQIVWQQGYKDEQGALPANCFSAGKNGYNIFTSNNHSNQYGLLITDNKGIIDCANETPDITAAPATLNLTHDSLVTNLDYNYTDDYYDYAHPLKRVDEYPLIKNVLCQQTLACCTDFIDKVNINNINICEGTSYMLPDSSVVKDEGLYDVTFKKALGCDSIRFYKVKLDKDVAKLSLGSDTCLGDKTSLIIKATSGFEQYYWMNNSIADSASIKITQQGVYTVAVNNVCGSKTDSIEVFDSCDYRVFIPAAFTPNGDRLNDYFRIPASNKNRLLNFSVYDRWGKRIFYTQNRSVGWDGTYKGEPLESGTFTYYLEMEGITGKRIVKKGYVLLIR